MKERQAEKKGPEGKLSHRSRGGNSKMCMGSRHKRSLGRLDRRGEGMFQKVGEPGQSGLCPGLCGDVSGSKDQDKGEPEEGREPRQEGKKLLRPECWQKPQAYSWKGRK